MLSPILDQIFHHNLCLSLIQQSSLFFKKTHIWSHRFFEWFPIRTTSNGPSKLTSPHPEHLHLLRWCNYSEPFIFNYLISYRFISVDLLLFFIQTMPFLGKNWKDFFHIHVGLASLKQFFTLHLGPSMFHIDQKRREFPFTLRLNDRQKTHPLWWCKHSRSQTLNTSLLLSIISVSIIDQSRVRFGYILLYTFYWDN